MKNKTSLTIRVFSSDLITSWYDKSSFTLGFFSLPMFIIAEQRGILRSCYDKTFTSVGWISPSRIPSLPNIKVDGSKQIAELYYF